MHIGFNNKNENLSFNGHQNKTRIVVCPETLAINLQPIFRSRILLAVETIRFYLAL